MKNQKDAIDLLRYEKLIRNIPKGEKNAIKTPQLLISMNYLERDKRSLQAMIEDARGEGILICSSSNGYYFPSKKEELEKYISSQKKRCKAHNKGLKPFIKELKKIEELENIENGKTLF